MRREGINARNGGKEGGREGGGRKGERRQEGGEGWREEVRKRR